MNISNPSDKPPSQPGQNIWQEHPSAVEDGPHAPSWVEKRLYQILDILPSTDKVLLKTLSANYLDQLAMTSQSTDLVEIFTLARKNFLAQLSKSGLLASSLVSSLDKQLEALEEELLANL